MINITEILDKCTKGTKLYSPIFGDVYLEKIRPHLAVVVNINKDEKNLEEFLYDGRYTLNGECMLFPSKNNRDWNTFQRPFQDGDFVTFKYNGSLVAFIFKEFISPVLVKHYFALYIGNMGYTMDEEIMIRPDEIRYATDEEKEKLLKAISENGYKWDFESKILKKKEPKFKNGDVVVSGAGNIALFSHTKNQHGKDIIYYHCILPPIGCGELEVTTDCGIGGVEDCVLAFDKQAERLFKALEEKGFRWNTEDKKLEKLAKPIFKVGDRIQYNNERPIRIIKSLEYDRYRLDNGNYLKFGDEDAYNLLNFDVSTLRPFDKVLVRDYDSQTWVANLFSHYIDNNFPFCCCGNLGSGYKQCIPFKYNDHLLGTTNNCDEYYKTWK